MTTRENAAANKPKPSKMAQTGVCPLSTRDICAKIIVFSEELNRLEFYTYQRVTLMRICESILLNDGATITALYSRQSGKSDSMAPLAFGLCVLLPVLAATFPNDARFVPFKNGVLIGIFGPNQESTGPIYERLRGRAESMHATAIMSDPEINVHLVQSRGDSLAFSNGSMVRAKTASDNSFVEGKTYHVIFVDEAQKVAKSKVDKEIVPMLAATNGTMIKIGTSWLSRGGFHNDIKMNMKVEAEGGVKNHFQFDYLDVIREKRATYDRQNRLFKAGKRATIADPFHLQYERFIEAEIKRQGGINSEEFKMNFRLMWQESRQIAIQERVIHACADPLIEANDRSRLYRASTRNVFRAAGLDLGKSKDQTVATIMEIDLTTPIVDIGKSNAEMQTPDQSVVYYNKTIVAWLALQGAYEGQYGPIIDFCVMWQVSHLMVDATGVGDPIYEALAARLSQFGIVVDPFKFGTNSGSDLYKYYLQEWNARRIKYAAGELTKDSKEFHDFIEQHVNLQREFSGNFLVVSAADGFHDDYADSAALALWATKDMKRGQIPTINPTEDVHVVSGNSARRAAMSSRGQGEDGRAQRYSTRRGYR